MWSVSVRGSTGAGVYVNDLVADTAASNSSECESVPALYSAAFRKTTTRTFDVPSKVATLTERVSFLKLPCSLPASSVTATPMPYASPHAVRVFASASHVTSHVTFCPASSYAVVDVDEHGSFSTVVVVSAGSPGRHSSSAWLRLRLLEPESPPPQLMRAATMAAAMPRRMTV